MKYLKEVILVVFSLTLILFSLMLKPIIKTDDYLVKELDISKEVSNFVPVNLDLFDKSVVKTNSITRTYKQLLTIDIPTVTHIAPKGSEILIKKGDIVDEGATLYRYEGIPFTSNSKLRLVQIVEQEGTKLVFEDLGNTYLAFTHIFSTDFRLENCHFYNRNYQNNKVELTPKEIYYNRVSGNYTFLLNNLYFDPYVLNGEEIVVTMDIETNTNHLYIEKEYLMYDASLDKHFVKKYMYSDKLGDGYRVIYVDVVDVYEEFILIEGELSVNNILLTDKNHYGKYKRV